MAPAKGGPKIFEAEILLAPKNYGGQPPTLEGEGGGGLEAPGFRVVNFAANLKREISHMKFAAPKSPPPLQGVHNFLFNQRQGPSPGTALVPVKWPSVTLQPPLATLQPPSVTVQPSSCI